MIFSHKHEQKAESVLYYATFYLFNSMFVFSFLSKRFVYSKNVKINILCISFINQRKE